jgi:hypothetical protein
MKTDATTVGHRATARIRSRTAKLSPSERRQVEVEIAAHAKTGELAKRWDVTASRISQIRREVDARAKRDDEISTLQHALTSMVDSGRLSTDTADGIWSIVLGSALTKAGR